MTTESVPSQTETALRPIPKTPEQLSAAWLSAALRSGGLDVEVDQVSIVPFGEGVGMMSGLVRAQLSYSRGDGPGR